MSDTKKVSTASWAAALDIVVSKPHSVDKRLAGQETIATFRGVDTESDSEFLLDHTHLATLVRKCLTGDDLKNKLSSVFLSDMRSDVAENGEADSAPEITLQKMISRKDKLGNYFQLVVRLCDTIQFIPLNTVDNGTYQLKLKSISVDKEDAKESTTAIRVDDKYCVEVRLSEECGPKQAEWVRGRLVPRLVAWAGSRAHAAARPQVDSVRLVGLEAYCAEYARIKNKYAADIVANWRESSDPEKFVHEDLGIAAYILLLWRQQRQREGWVEDRRQTFVDLGCGNGLLVYILTMEGHRGVGHDIRSRGIWSWYPASVRLQENTVVPGLDVKFPDVDWILGNHSDELTPWIPVLAALSGPNTNFWILPCCPFSFTAKYQRQNALKSVWRDYLDWLLRVCGDIGFDIQEDRMKIPSTKRVCLVGYQQNIVDTAQLHNLVNCDTRTFVPRQKVEKVRNCTKVDRNLTNTIVLKVVDWCLSQSNIVQMNGRSWNQGGSLPLGDIVGRLQADGVDLSQLKQECGGLQTLFRNHHFIFVVEKGCVRLRVPGKDVKRGSKETPSERLKTKPCWHFHNHPDGCLLSEEACQWIH